VKRKIEQDVNRSLAMERYSAHILTIGFRMQSYYELLVPAVARLEANSGDARRALYDRARTALVAQLRGVDPPLDNSDIIRQRLALEDAIRNIEVDYKTLANFDRVQRKPPKRPGVVMRVLHALRA